MLAVTGNVISEPNYDIITYPYHIQPKFVQWVNGTQIAVANDGPIPSGVYIWNVTSGEIIAKQDISIKFYDEEHPFPLQRMLFSINPNRTAIVSGNSNSNLVIWDFGKNTTENIEIKDVMYESLAWGDQLYIAGIRYERGYSTLDNNYAINFTDNTIMTYDPIMKQKTDIMTVNATVNTMDATVAGALAIGLENGSVIVKNITTTRFDFNSSIVEVKWRENSLFVAEGQQVHVITGKKIETFSFEKSITAIAPSPTGDRIAVGFKDGDIKIQSNSTQIMLNRLDNFTEVFDIDWEENKILVAQKSESIFSNGGFFVFDANNGELVTWIKGVDPDKSIQQIPETPSNGTSFAIMLVPVAFISGTYWRKRQNK